MANKSKTTKSTSFKTQGSKPTGRPQGIESPEALWAFFVEFRDQKKKNPIMVVEHVGKDGRKVSVPHQRPLTMQGFHAWMFEHQHVSNTKDYFGNRDNRYEAFSDICCAIKAIIQTDQIEGGMCGIYSTSITQRLNNLVEKVESTMIEQPLFPDVPAKERNEDA